MFPPFAHASSNYSMLVGKQGTGSYEFAQELERLWEIPAFQMESALMVVFEKNAQNRIRRLRNRQGDFTVLSAQEAHDLLPHNLEIAVISLLWPNVLYVLTDLPQLTELNPDPTLSFDIQDNSVYFAETWNQAIPFEDYNPAQFQWFQPSEGGEFFLQEAQTLIVTAPYPLEAFPALSPFYRSIPVGKSLQSLNLQAHPWLTRQNFSNQKDSPPSSNFLTSFPILVARGDISENLVQKILNMLYSQQDFVRPHPLFRFLQPGNNQLFQESYRFHSAAKEYFNF